MWQIDLTGSTALVTGAGRGIGRAIASGLAEAGADIVGLSRTSKDLEALDEEVRAARRGFCPLVFDLAEVDRIGPIVEEAWNWRGRLDLLVNAAGMMIRTDPPHVDPAQWDRLMAVNLRAPFFLSQEVGQRMVEQGSGCIVNVASLAGEVVTGASLMYQASKAALIQLTRGFASRLGPGVRVNAVGPGYIRTSLNEEWLSLEENSRYVVERTAAARIGLPEDVVGAVVFLASPGAGYITGQHLRVDGGWGV